MGGKIYTATVSQLNRFIKQMMDGTPILNNIWVKGEISNYKQHYSGHCYLTLKDEGGVLKAVMFKSSALRLAFAPENGMKVLARGRVSVYERDGAYQLYIEEMQPDGVGSLHIAYEQLKAKLLEEGLFDEAHKKPLPQYPSTIGVVTATTGAAVRDIINVLSRRYPCAKVLIYPTLVQGEGASAGIVEAIEYCISNDILKEFLLEHKSEVTDMLKIEYDEAKTMAHIREDSYEEGEQAGVEKGTEIKLIEMVCRKLSKNKSV